MLEVDQPCIAKGADRWFIRMFRRTTHCKLENLSNLSSQFPSNNLFCWFQKLQLQNGLLQTVSCPGGFIVGSRYLRSSSSKRCCRSGSIPDRSLRRL